MLRKVIRCTGRVSVNTRPHQLRWDDREMGTVMVQLLRSYKAITEVFIKSAT